MALAISIDRSNWPWPIVFRCDRQVEGKGALASAAFLRGQGEDVHRRALHQLCLHEVGQVSRRASEHLGKWACTRPRCLSSQHGSGVGANSEGGVALAISIDRSNWPWPSAFRCDRQVEGRGALASAAFLRGQGEDVIEGRSINCACTKSGK